MNFEKLFSMQKELDSHIETNHDIQNENLFEKKVLALLVEFGELANETRCFKFWSLKPPAPREKIGEEYVDGLHFILSLGLEKGFEKKEIHISSSGKKELTEQFLEIYSLVNKFRNNATFENYEQLFNEFLLLGEFLGFGRQEIEQAYILKNEVNYQRQEKGY
ncbi:dUTP diphosphatase [Neobacillus sp. D3-1R]|uniref:dUTP diphosphatase n=1 Tax=Neobacillus sp. D3-1R TaxID=3445778 RepID=UPI003F9F4516